MKLDQIVQTPTQEITLGATKEMSFSIDDDNPIIFSILRDKMYTNKIGSICREVASNSRDANREAGRADTPIEIELTNNLELLQSEDTSIIFRDFGIGITPERMENIFVKYAASTKRSNNSQTGGFGLGAKTPFAYTDSFVVSTKCFVNGTKKHFIYNAIIDGSGKGKMILLSEKPTTDRTGTEIIIPVQNSKDRNAFETESYYYTMLWGNVNYKGFAHQKPSLKIEWEQEGFKVIEAPQIGFGVGFGESQYYGIIDGIPYPVFPKEFEKGLGDDFRILFDLPLEHVTLNANRENIQIDKKSNEYLIEKVMTLYRLLEIEKTKYLENHKSFVEAFSKKSELYTRRTSSEDVFMFKAIKTRKDAHRTGYMLNSNTKVKYDGEELLDTLGLKKHKIYRITFKNGVKEDGKLVSIQVVKKEESFYHNHTLQVYYNGDRSITAKKCLTIFNSLEDQKSFLIIIPNKEVSEEDLEEDMVWVRSTDLEIHDFTLVKDSVKKKVLKPAVKSVSVRVFKEPSTTHSLEIKEGKFYDDYFDETVKPSNTCFMVCSRISEATFVAHRLADKNSFVHRFFPNKFRCYIVTENNYNKHFKSKGFNTLDEVFEAIDKEVLVKMRLYFEATRCYKAIEDIIIEEEMFEVLPKSFPKLREIYLESTKFVGNLQIMRHKDLDALGITKPNFNFKGFETKAEEILERKFPLFVPYFNEHALHSRHYWGRTELQTQRAINILKTYIKNNK